MVRSFPLTSMKSNDFPTVESAAFVPEKASTLAMARCPLPSAIIGCMFSTLSPVFAMIEPCATCQLRLKSLFPSLCMPTATQSKLKFVICPYESPPSSIPPYVPKVNISISWALSVWLIEYAKVFLPTTASITAGVNDRPNSRMFEGFTWQCRMRGMS